MKMDNLLDSPHQINPTCFNRLTPMANRSTKLKHIIGYHPKHFTLCSRKQDHALYSPPPSKRPQAAKWLFAAFLFFDNVPHNPLSDSRELWGALSNGLAKFHTFYRKTSTCGEKGCFVKNLQCGVHDVAYGFLHWHESNFSLIQPKVVHIYIWLLPMIRAPPLLKFGLRSPYQISEESEETILQTRYFRKKDPFCKPEEIEWIEMSGRDYYRFVIDPKNKGRCFVDMGNVVLECTKAEYKRYKTEDDHSRYILEQSEEWITLSLCELGDSEQCSGEELIPNEAEDVCDAVIRNIQGHTLQKALQMLSEDDYHMIMLKYDPRYTISEKEIGNIFGLSQSGVSRRLTAIKNFLKKFVIESEKSSQ